MVRKRLKSPGVVRIEVLQETIDEAETRSSSHCMIAESIKKSLPHVTYVAVDMMTIRWTDPTTGLRYTFLTPRKVAISLINFDQGVATHPYGFTLGRPAQIRRSGWKAGHPNTERRSDLEIDSKTGEKKKRPVRARINSKGSIIGGSAIPQMSSRREFGMRLFIK